MSSSGNERSHSNHSVTSKVLTCHICDKSVKDYRLSSHLLFGSLQCKDCKQKFRYCKDFDSFRKSKDNKKREKCLHRTLKWTRDPVEYLERKLRKELERSKSGDHHPSMKEVTKGMISYMGKLKPIECKSPWRYAIEKLKKYVSLQHNISRSHEKEVRKVSHGSHRHEREKCAKKNGSSSHREKKVESGSREKKENDHNRNSFQTVLNKTAEEESKQEDINMYLNNIQSIDETFIEDNMIPQCVEEIIIPQTDWEIDIVSFNEFEECNKSVAISLGKRDHEDFPLVVEEVYITKHDELGVITLIIEEIECSSESELNAKEIEDNISLLSEDNVAPLSEVCENYINPVIDASEELQEEINEENVKPRADTNEDKLKSVEESCQNEVHCKRKSHDNKLKDLAIICGSRRAELKKSLDKKDNEKKEKRTSFEKGNSEREPREIVKAQNFLNEAQSLSKFNLLRKSCSEQVLKTNEQTPKEQFQKRRSYRMKNVICSKIHESLQENGRSQKHLRSFKNISTGISKYNLRSRTQLSNSFLQKLDAYEKKKLWEKLIPTARKLRNLRARGSEEILSSLCLPIGSDENDDDFLVDVLLSKALDIQQVNKITYLDSENDGNEIAFLLNQVKKAIKQFTFSVDEPFVSPGIDSSKSFANHCVKNTSIETREWEANTKSNERKKLDTKCLDRMVFGKDSPKKRLKTYYVSPPSDGNYYVVTYPSQPFITECPMCYFRVFPAMFSLNLVTNLATTKCVGCTLTIYVVQEPNDDNYLPKIVFRREDPSDNDPKDPKPGRYKELNRSKLQKKVSVKNFFKQ